MRSLGRIFTLVLWMVLAADVHAASRIKDIASLQSSRDNQLVGYGLVVGLNGTGDSLRNAPFTENAMRSMLDTLGIATADGRARLKNIASVIVTANFPAYVQHGSRIDVEVSSLGDATSLEGGQLIMTPLLGADGVIYAVAQGAVSSSGYFAQGAAESVTQGTPTTGRIVNGAIIERELSVNLADEASLTVQLRNPDFTTAIAVTDAINAFSKTQYGAATATEIDARTVQVNIPGDISTARFVASIENLTVTPDAPAVVVLDAASGTVVITSDVRVSPVAVSHGNLTVRVSETPTVVQPSPFSRGETAVEPLTNIEVTQEGTMLGVVDGASLRSIIDGLNRLGVGPRETIAILQTIKNAGALQADLVVQ